MDTLLDEPGGIERADDRWPRLYAIPNWDWEDLHGGPQTVDVLAGRLAVFFSVAGWTWARSTESPAHEEIKETLRLLIDGIDHETAAVETGRIRVEPRRDEETGALEEIEVLLVVGSL